MNMACETPPQKACDIAHPAFPVFSAKSSAPSESSVAEVIAPQKEQKNAAFDTAGLSAAVRLGIFRQSPNRRGSPMEGGWGDNRGQRVIARKRLTGGKGF